MRQGLCFAVSFTLFLSTLIPVWSGENSEASLLWAERWLEKASVPPTSSQSCMVGVMDCIENAFQWIVAKRGPSVRAYQGLARSQEQQGRYDKAVRSLERALSLSDRNPSIGADLREARRLLEVSRLASESLAKDQVVLRVLVYPPSRQQNLWLVLSAHVEHDPNIWFPRYTNVRLTLYDRGTEGLKQIWKSDRLGVSGWTDGEFSDVRAYVLDVTGDSWPEVMVYKRFAGGGATPSHVDIFTSSKGRMVKILGVSSQLPLWVRDLNRDGRVEVGSFYVIGTDMCHAEQPYWTDIYAYKRGTYQLANGDFPREYLSLLKEIQKTLARYPKDWELHKYLGITHAILGHSKSALRAYRRAEALASGAFTSETDPEFRAYVRRQIEDIRRRANKLGLR